jgi:hypothetical protein
MINLLLIKFINFFLVVLEFELRDSCLLVALPFEPLIHPFLFWIFLRLNFTFCLELWSSWSLTLSSKDYGCEPPVPNKFVHFKWTVDPWYLQVCGSRRLLLRKTTHAQEFSAVLWMLDSLLQNTAQLPLKTCYLSTNLRLSLY